MIEAMNSYVAQNRLFWSRVFGIIVLVTVVTSSPTWEHELPLALTFEFSGFTLLMVATVLRLWCVTYIGGRKDGTLITEGPYSVVRNPLYLSSLIGAVGFGLAVENVAATLILFFVFVIFYPAVVRREEKALAAKFASQYDAYKARVPRWCPRWSLYREPAEYVIRPRYLRKAYFNAMWFMWAFMLWEAVEKLQELGLIPVVWHGGL